MSRDSKVFIIGNGFDLSLGWETKYSDFAKSSLWPFNDSKSPLGRYLQEKKETERWLDLEAALLDYAKHEENTRIQSVSEKLVEDEICQMDSYEFHQLTEKLTAYLNWIQGHQISTTSIAARVLKAVVNNGYFDKIFTFNYTNLKRIGSRLGLHDFSYEYVHGSLENNDIILGVDDHQNLKRGYDYLYKTFSRNYSSTNIKYALQEANEVVFFGHSLGETDYHYFKEFFQDQSNSKMKRDNWKKITIFTFDENARLNILRQLRDMNGGSLGYLYSNNDFQIICTDGFDDKKEDKLKRFEKHLRKDSVAEENRKLQLLASSLP